MKLPVIVHVVPNMSVSWPDNWMPNIVWVAKPVNVPFPLLPNPFVPWKVWMKVPLRFPVAETTPESVRRRVKSNPNRLIVNVPDASNVEPTWLVTAMLPL